MGSISVRLNTRGEEDDAALEGSTEGAVEGEATEKNNLYLKLGGGCKGGMK